MKEKAVQQQLKEELIVSLQGEYKLYVAILELSKAKCQALVQNDRQTLQKATAALQDHLAKIEVHQEKRQELVDRIAERTGREKKSLTLPELERLCEDERFGQIRTKIKNVAEELRALNEKNAMLVTQAKEIFSGLTDVLYSALGQSQCYDSQGKRKNMEGGYFEGQI